MWANRKCGFPFSLLSLDYRSLSPAWGPSPNLGRPDTPLRPGSLFCHQAQPCDYWAPWGLQGQPECLSPYHALGVPKGL